MYLRTCAGRLCTWRSGPLYASKSTRLVYLSMIRIWARAVAMVQEDDSSERPGPSVRQRDNP